MRRLAVVYVGALSEYPSGLVGDDGNDVVDAQTDGNSGCGVCRGHSLST